MLYVATGCLIVAAVLGAYLLSYVLQNKNTPKGIAFTHGPLAALGLILLMLYAILYSPAPIVSIIIFILAALGGFMLIYRDLSGKSLPKWMALLHGITALIGLLLLIMFIF